MQHTTLDITEARKEFNRLDERAKGSHIVRVTRHGKPVFDVVDTAFLSSLLETIELMSDEATYRMFMQSLDDIRHGRVHEHEDVRSALFGDDDA